MNLFKVLFPFSTSIPNATVVYAADNLSTLFKDALRGDNWKFNVTKRFHYTLWDKMSGFYKFCVTSGLIIMTHAAYSATQHRFYLRLTEQDFTNLPVDILIQCAFGLLLACYGVVHVAGSFKEIRANAELGNKTWDMLSNRQAFYVFNHRGMALYDDFESPEGDNYIEDNR